MCSIE
jgi:hypothetical protein